MDTGYDLATLRSECVLCGQPISLPYCECVKAGLREMGRAPLIMVTPHADGSVTVSHTLGRPS